LPVPEKARVAVDLGAESCRVSLLRFRDGEPQIELVHRVPNGPTRRGGALVWPLQRLLAGIEDGLRKAAAAAPEGIASIAVDGWSVDYVRLGADGEVLQEPFCYRDERTTASKQAADAVLTPLALYGRTGALPLRINTVYQLLADRGSGIDGTPWVMLPEYVLYWLSGRRVAELTNASHTGLVNLKTRAWDREVFDALGLPLETAPPLVEAGTVLGPLTGPLASMDAFRQTQVIAPATHDTASAVAGIGEDLNAASYLCTGTWSLMGTIGHKPVTTEKALDAAYTNLAAATGDGVCFHTLINGMWLLRQCMDGWAAEGRGWTVDALVQESALRSAGERIMDVNAEPLMLEQDMPRRINRELIRQGQEPIADVPGNEPLFARLIFESLAAKYAGALASMETMLGRRLERIYMLGGANRNKVLVALTEERTGRPVTTGASESSTIGNLAVQLAASEADGGEIDGSVVRAWAGRLCRSVG
jgi:rhamnulokinase